MNKKTILATLMCSLLLCSVVLMSGCISEEETQDGKYYKSGLLIDVIWYNQWYNIPTSIDLVFNDGCVVNINYINQSSKNCDITFLGLYSTLKHNINSNVSLFYTVDGRWNELDSFSVMEI